MLPNLRILSGVHWNQDGKDPLRQWAPKESSDLLSSLAGAMSSNEVRDPHVVVHLIADKGRPVGERNARNSDILGHLHRLPISNQASNLVHNVRSPSTNLSPYERASSTSMDGGPKALVATEGPHHLTSQTI